MVELKSRSSVDTLRLSTGLALVFVAIPACSSSVEDDEHDEPVADTQLALTDPCAGSPAIGTVCANGAIFAGTFKNRKYMVPPINEVAQRSWNGGRLTYPEDVSGVQNVSAANKSSTQLGSAATTAILASANVDAAYTAAAYCDNLVSGGYSDWYLPSKSELTYLYCKSSFPAGDARFYPHESPGCAAFGGKSSTLPFNKSVSSWYLSASEYDRKYVWYMRMDYGGNFQTTKSSVMNIRCVRSYP